MRHLVLAALCLAASSFAAPAKPKAPPAPLPIAVLPPATTPVEQPLALVMQLWAMEHGGLDGLVVGPHAKQLLGMASHEGLPLESLGEPAQAAKAAVAVGAEAYVFGTLTRTDKGLTLVATAVRGAKTKKRTAELAPQTHLAVAQGAQVLVDVLFEAAGLPAPKEKVAPFGANPEAALAAAQGIARVLRQPMGIENPAVLDGPELAKAIADEEKALSLDPDLAPARAALGLAYAILGDDEKALTALKPLDAKTADQSLYWIARFWLVTRYQTPADGEVVLREAIARHPDFLLARGYLGELLGALGEHAKAEAAWREYLTLVPKEPFVKARLAKEHARQGKHDEAISTTQQALVHSPQSPELQLQLASRLIDAQKYVEAQKLLEGLAAKPEARGEVLVRLGYVRWLLGKLDEAQAVLQRALDKATSPGEWRTRGRAHYDLALVAAKRGDAEATQASLARAQTEGFKLTKVHPSLEAAAMALDRSEVERTQKKQPPVLVPKGPLPKEATLFPMDADGAPVLTPPTKPTKKPAGYVDFRSPFANTPGGIPGAGLPR